MIHTYNEETIYFDLAYKNRKEVRITIDFYGQIMVEAPKNKSTESILAVIEKNWEPIIQKTKEIKGRMEEPKEKFYRQGEELLFLGKTYMVSVLQKEIKEKDYVEIVGDTLQVYVDHQEEDAVKTALKRFFYQKCKALVQERIRYYQPQFSTKPKSIFIADDHKNWGTCNGKRELTFNWKLVMAPLESIDYVVVHEMCHMTHLNHDRSFWRLVGKILPDYEKRSNWLTLSSWKMHI